MTSQFLQSHEPLLSPPKAIGSAHVTMTRLAQNSHQTSHKTGSEFVISNGMKLDMKAGLMDAGFGKVKLTNTIGPTLVHPAHTDAQFMVAGDHMVQVLIIEQWRVSEMFHLDPAVVSRAIETVGYRQIADPVIFRSARDMWHHADRQGAAAQLMIDGLLHVVLARLMQHADLDQPTPKDTGLTQFQLARVVDMMESHLHLTVTMEMLADAIGMKTAHFARMFQNTTGETPYRYLQSWRLVKARGMLEETDQDVCQVARACGFASAAHLLTALNSDLGYSPGLHRRGRCT
ncbi:helix-turn-helix transcriptional regulator [Sulfitobacter albidus]|uniref:Helix-turn-helix transcriptional regulator n=1 Tax=Sulfitobacter albidus TaxID=2829501 RepID=A0A975JB78_9RHOB|nr:AraC family transcriptional regulator [Sulfitobacter albidus]QUJ75253.1 helix-turn-helix transcriptional regulator [Sulfitobacter albidus]